MTFVDQAPRLRMRFCYVVFPSPTPTRRLNSSIARTLMQGQQRLITPFAEGPFLLSAWSEIYNLPAGTRVVCGLARAKKKREGGTHARRAD